MAMRYAVARVGALREERSWRSYVADVANLAPQGKCRADRWEDGLPKRQEQRQDPAILALEVLRMAGVTISQGGAE